MKLFKNIGLIAVVATLVVVSSCKKKDDPDPTEKIQLGKLIKTWTISSAKLESTDRTTDFTNMTLVLAGTFDGNSPAGPYNYTVTGTRPNPSPWPASGTWSFGEGEAATSVIIRDAGTASETPVAYVLSADAKQLTVNFNVSGTGFVGSTRTAAVEGDWEFVFTTN